MSTSIEKVEEFIKTSNIFTWDWGTKNLTESGDGFHDGTGIGRGYASGSSTNSGSGTGSGIDMLCNEGYGIGWGHMCGSGSDGGIGSGASFHTNNTLSINNRKVYYIDDMQTIITNVYSNIAKGFIVNPDFTETPCYIAKRDNLFAHGETIHEALESLIEKLFNTLPIEERIELFLSEFSDLDKKHPAKVFYDWHNKLTGSCRMGRDSFCANHGINIDKDTYSAREFLELTKNDFGGDIIRKLLDRI